MAVLFFSCEKKQESAAAEAPLPANLVQLTPEQVQSFGLQTALIETHRVQDPRQVSGTVEAPPSSTAAVSWPLSGNVHRVLVTPGQSVRAGQPLMTVRSLDAIQLQQDYLQALSQLRFQEEELKRQQELNQADVGAKRKLQEAQANVQTTRAGLAGMAARMRLLGLSPDALAKNGISSTLTVRAPIGGYVRTVNAAVGKPIGGTDVLAEIVSTAAAYLRLNVFEKDAPRLRIGQQVDLPDQQLRATITSIGQTFDGPERTVQVMARVPGGRLKPGQFVRATLYTGTRQAQVLPREALVREGDMGTIFVEEQPGRYRSVGVTPGTENGDFIEFTARETLTNARIVTKGARLLAAEHSKGAGGEEE